MPQTERTTDMSTLQEIEASARREASQCYAKDCELRDRFSNEVRALSSFLRDFGFSVDKKFGERYCRLLCTAELCGREVHTEVTVTAMLDLKQIMWCYSADDPRTFTTMEQLKTMLIKDFEKSAKLFAKQELEDDQRKGAGLSC